MDLGVCDDESMTINSTLQRFADDLWQAALSGEPIQPITGHSDDATVSDAYEIQTLNIERHLTNGARIIGHKIGLTSRAMQEMMGVDTPDFGHLLDTMFIEDRDAVRLDSFIQPRVEPEIAFKLREALPTGGCTAADVLAATEAIAPCIELIDSRIKDWNIGLIDTIADNASSAAFLVSDWSAVPDGYADSAVELLINGELVESGSTRDVLDDPAAAVAWLANELGRHGTVIEAGHVVLSGSCTRARDVQAGDRVLARFHGLGEIEIQFSEMSGK